MTALEYESGSIELGSLLRVGICDQYLALRRVAHIVRYDADPFRKMRLRWHVRVLRDHYPGDFPRVTLYCWARPR